MYLQMHTYLLNLLIFTLQSCNMQLTDEPEKRCYPLGDHLYCRSCHIRQGEKLGYTSSESVRLSRSAHRTTNFTNSEFQFPQFKVLQSVFIFLCVKSYIGIF